MKITALAKLGVSGLQLRLRISAKNYLKMHKFLIDFPSNLGSSPRNKRAHSSDPGARVKRPRLTNLKRPDGAVLKEPRLIDFEDPTDPVVLAVSGIGKGKDVMF